MPPGFAGSLAKSPVAASHLGDSAAHIKVRASFSSTFTLDPGQIIAIVPTPYADFPASYFTTDAGTTWDAFSANFDQRHAFTPTVSAVDDPNFTTGHIAWRGLSPHTYADPTAGAGHPNANAEVHQQFLGGAMFIRFALNYSGTAVWTTSGSDDNRQVHGRGTQHPGPGNIQSRIQRCDFDSTKFDQPDDWIDSFAPRLAVGASPTANGKVYFPMPATSHEWCMRNESTTTKNAVTSIIGSVGWHAPNQNVWGGLSAGQGFFAMRNTSATDAITIVAYGFADNAYTVDGQSVLASLASKITVSPSAHQSQSHSSNASDISSLSSIEDAPHANVRNWLVSSGDMTRDMLRDQQYNTVLTKQAYPSQLISIAEAEAQHGQTRIVNGLVDLYHAYMDPNTSTAALITQAGNLGSQMMAAGGFDAKDLVNFVTSGAKTKGNRAGPPPPQGQRGKDVTFGDIVSTGAKVAETILPFIEFF